MKFKQNNNNCPFSLTVDTGILIFFLFFIDLMRMENDFKFYELVMFFRLLNESKIKEKKKHQEYSKL